MSPLKASFALPLVTLLAACTGNVDGTPGPESRAVGAEDAVTLTTVHLHADGTSDQVTEQISRAQQAEERVARAAIESGKVLPADAPISSSCATGALVLYNEPEEQGSRQLCFIGAGVAELDQYRYSTVCDKLQCFLYSWSGEVASYHAGQANGVFYGRSPESFTNSSENFKAFGSGDLGTFSVYELALDSMSFPPPLPIVTSLPTEISH